ncbi:hypothetical protein ACFQ34_33820 [Pseudonocardia benzenivorans]|uniref:Neocarzinostatin family protein n=1 Tax=Pseudonocardia benzenivorans TaxID=228005 RepID=A0ABW3VUA2_9PSEU
MAAVGAQTPGLAGIQPTTSAASAGGDTVPTGSRVHVLNTGGAPVNCTITTPGTARGGLAIADKVIACPNGTGAAGLTMFDVPADPYDPSGTGSVALAWSATASVVFFATGGVLS